MRALSLLQPWAWLVAEGHKPVENRRWHLPMKMRGVPFLIHSSGSRQKSEFAAAKELAGRVAWQTRMPPVKIPDPDELVYGSLLAVAEAHDCLCPAERQMSLLDDSSPHPWWMRAQHGFLLQNVRKLQTPVICRGNLGFWQVPPTILSQIETPTP